MAKKPVHQVKISRVVASIWETETENGSRYNVTFQRFYKQGDDWKYSESFGRDDLLLVAKAADQAHSWILEQ